LPARLLLEVPPLRQVLPALGARGLSGAPVMMSNDTTTWPLPARALEALGRISFEVVESMGRFGLFFIQAISLIFVPPFKLRRLAERINFFGFRSLTIVMLTGAFTGMVLSLQIFLTLSRVGSEAFVGPAVAISLIRELGPVLCAVFVTGLAGSAL